jgi:type II secretory ATPase GspE/PulE/Tfp pilus assembly ATPase PilB-like protein
MSDAQSIEDLLKKKTDAPGPKKLASELSPGEKFTDKIATIRLKEKEVEVERAATAAGYSYANLAGFPITADAISTIAREQSEKMRAVCFVNTGAEIRIGAIDPALPSLEETRFQIAERTHANTVVYMVSEHSFEIGMHVYDILPSIRNITKGVSISEDEIKRFTDIHSFDRLQAALAGANVTDIVVILVAAALNTRSSDIHIEAEEQAITVRFRIDGILTKVAVIPGSEWVRMVSRIKLFSGLKINVTDQPQDGRFTINLGKEKIDVRVSTIPTAYGESVVMRLLRSSATGIKLESLGLRAPYDEILKAQIQRPNGMIVTTGPTGSGKTTTLYAILLKLNTPDVKIITLEDPVEYRLEGIAQSQIDHTKDYTFAKGLRSILRQDPDVIMVGEIRDLETAETAIQAALTGHLLLSTIHTNDAAGAIPRFMSMGVKPFLLAPALNCIIGQRLCRTIHDKCKEEMKLDDDTLARVKKVLADISPKSGVKVDLDKIKFFHGKGCDECNGIGYKGRIGIYEILAMSPDIEKVILSGNVSEYLMRDIAKAAGMITMAQDGILKALDGLTTVDEVFRVAE